MERRIAEVKKGCRKKEVTWERENPRRKRKVFSRRLLSSIATRPGKGGISNVTEREFTTDQ